MLCLSDFRKYKQFIIFREKFLHLRHKSVCVVEMIKSVHWTSLNVNRKDVHTNDSFNYNRILVCTTVLNINETATMFFLEKPSLVIMCQFQNFIINTAMVSFPSTSSLLF